MDKLESLLNAFNVYVISKKNNIWQVNKTIYDLRSQEDREHVNIIPASERYNPHMGKHFRKKKLDDVFASKEEAQTECDKRNGIIE